MFSTVSTINHRYFDIVVRDFAHSLDGEQSTEFDFQQISAHNPKCGTHHLSSITRRTPTAGPRLSSALDTLQGSAATYQVGHNAKIVPESPMWEFSLKFEGVVHGNRNKTL